MAGRSEVVIRKGVFNKSRLRARARLRAWAAPLAVLAGLLAYVLMAPAGWLLASTAPYRLPAGRVPPAPVAIVLGAGLDAAGRPMPFLIGRLRTAADLYHRGKVRVILVTGDNSRKDYDEPTAMRDFLVSEGVPAQRIVLDYAGFDTWDSCARAKKIFGVDRATVVTQRFHLPRAVALCRAAGIRAYGVGHDTMSLDRATTEYGYVRELPAALKALADLTGHPEPTFLGPRESGVQQALNS